MTTKTNTFDGGSDAAAITVANSGGASGIAFDVVRVGTPATAAYTSTLATAGLGAYLDPGGSGFGTGGAVPVAEAASAGIGYEFGAATKSGGRVDLYLTDRHTFYPDNLLYLDIGSSGYLWVGLSQGRFWLYSSLNGNNVSRQSATMPQIPVGQWVRVEWNLNFTGSRFFDLRVYDSGGELYARFQGNDPTLENTTASRVIVGPYCGGPLNSVFSPFPYYVDNLTANDTGLPYELVVAAPVADTEAVAPVPGGRVGGVYRHNNADGLADGQQPDNVNSAGASGDPWDFYPGTFAVVAAAVDGRVAYVWKGNDYPGDVNELGWNLDEVSKVSGSFDFKYVLGPHSPYACFFTIYYGGLPAGTVQMNGAGVLQPGDGSSFTDFTTELTPDVWRRLEWEFDYNADDPQWTVTVFTDATGDTILESHNQGAVYPYPPPVYTWISFGGAQGADIYMDNLVVDTGGEDIEAHADIDLAVPPADAEAAAPEPAVPGLDISLDAPVADTAVTTPAPTSNVAVTLTVEAPPATAEAAAPGLRLVDGEVALRSPLPGAYVPSVRPVFQFSVTTNDPAARVQVQYATDPSFTDEKTLTSATIPYGSSVAFSQVKATEPVTDDTTYFWRARLLGTYDVGPWTDYQSFTVSFLDGHAMAGGYWFVSAAQAPTPHLWWIKPDRGRPGDECTAVGTGFGPTTVTVTIAGVQAEDATLFTVAPTSDAYTADRLLDIDSDLVDAGHQTVRFTVPEDIPPPGGPLYVDGS